MTDLSRDIEKIADTLDKLYTEMGSREGEAVVNDLMDELNMIIERRRNQQRFSDLLKNANK